MIFFLISICTAVPPVTLTLLAPGFSPNFKGCLDQRSPPRCPRSRSVSYIRIPKPSLPLYQSTASQIGRSGPHISHRIWMVKGLHLLFIIAWGDLIIERWGGRWLIWRPPSGQSAFWWAPRWFNFHGTFPLTFSITDDSVRGDFVPLKSALRWKDFPLGRDLMKTLRSDFPHNSEIPQADGSSPGKPRHLHQEPQTSLSRNQ